MELLRPFEVRSINFPLPNNFFLQLSEFFGQYSNEEHFDPEEDIKESYDKKFIRIPKMELNYVAEILFRALNLRPKFISDYSAADIGWVL